MKTATKFVLGALVTVGAVISACAPAPGGSSSLPSVSLQPVSIDPSAAADAVITVLNELDAAIASNQTPTGLTVEERDALQGLAGSIRAAVETGDLSAAGTSFEELSVKVDEFAAKLDTDTGATLRDAVTQLRGLLIGG